MTQRPLRSNLAALLLGATLLLPWLAGSAAGAAQPAPRHPAAVASVLPEPFARLWQALVQLVRGSSAPGKGSQGDSGCSANPDGHCGS